MIWAISILIVVQLVGLILTKRAFRKWAYVTKEHGCHLMAVNKILYLHEVSLQNHRKVLNARQNTTH